jgi:hypothetical protein
MGSAIDELELAPAELGAELPHRIDVSRQAIGR